MGRLRPGAEYVYEKANGITYAREVGAHPGDRFEIGRDWNYTDEPKILGMPLNQVAVYVDMVREAEHNPALQAALEHARIVYELCRDHSNNEVKWHPV
jgi:hypothetical protein